MENIASEIGVGGLTAAADVLSRPASEFDNDPTVESMWAIKAFEHAEVYFNIICSVDPKLLRLTRHDDEIYKVFRELFPEMKVSKLREEDLKSAKAKQGKDLTSSDEFCSLAKPKLPPLRDPAIKFLNIPASSAQLERVFTDWSHELCPSRKKLTFERSKKFIYGYHTLKLKHVASGEY